MLFCLSFYQILLKNSCILCPVFTTLAGSIELPAVITPMSFVSFSYK